MCIEEKIPLCFVFSGVHNMFNLLSLVFRKTKEKRHMIILQKQREIVRLKYHLFWLNLVQCV